MHWNASRRRTKLPTPLAFCCRATRGSFRGAPYSLTGACSLVCTIRLRAWQQRPDRLAFSRSDLRKPFLVKAPIGVVGMISRSEEHTSELQSLIRISYSVFCLKKKNKQNSTYT